MGYGDILKKHGLTKTAAKVEGEATAKTAAAANGVSGAMGNLTIGDGETGSGSSQTTYAGELNELAPAALVRDERPPAMMTKYRGYNTDAAAMKQRMLKRHAARGGADGT